MIKGVQDRAVSVQPIKSALKLKILDDADIRVIDETALGIRENHHVSACQIANPNTYLVTITKIVKPAMMMGTSMK